MFGRLTWAAIAMGEAALPLALGRNMHATWKAK